MSIVSHTASFKRPLLSVNVFACVCIFVHNFDAKYWVQTTCEVKFKDFKLYLQGPNGPNHDNTS